MNSRPASHPAPAACLAATAALWLAGCASTPSDTRRLTASDFASDDTNRPVANADSIPQSVIAPEPTPPVTITGPLAASEGLVVVASAGPPAASPDSPQPIGESVFVDARIGDVNGKAIYAGEFLEPMGARLRALSREKEMTLDKWREQAAGEISRQLDDFVTTELLRAEALSKFTPERKAGFLAFMESLQRNLQSENMGSQALTRKKLEEREGLTEAQWRRREESKQLVRSEYFTVNSRVHVSPRDSKLYYQRNIEQFVPPAAARFRRIGVPSAEPDAIAEIQRRLDAKEPFIDVALDELNSFKFQGGLIEKTFRGERAEARLFETPALNEAARAVAPGEWVGPIEVRGETNWLFLESLEQKRVEWYEAQVKINEQLFNEGFLKERERHIMRLAGRSTITPKQEMGLRLLAIAEERFFKPLEE